MTNLTPGDGVELTDATDEALGTYTAERRQVRIPVKFTDVYDGVEHERVAYVDVTVPEPDADIDEWADDEIRPHTGDGNAVDKDAGYFAEIITFHARPDLVGREFEWI